MNIGLMCHRTQKDRGHVTRGKTWSETNDQHSATAEAFMTKHDDRIVFRASPDVFIFFEVFIDIVTSVLPPDSHKRTMAETLGLCKQIYLCTQLHAPHTHLGLSVSLEN